MFFSSSSRSRIRISRSNITKRAKPTTDVEKANLLTLFEKILLNPLNPNPLFLPTTLNFCSEKEPTINLPRTPKTLEPTLKSLSSDHITSLESTLQTSLDTHNTDEAWKSFKLLTSNSTFPISKHLSNSIVNRLSSLKETHNLKRAFASVIFLLEKNPQSLKFENIGTLLQATKSANTAALAFALIKSMFKNRVFPPFSLWGDVLFEISRKNGSFVEILNVFSDNCKIALDEKLDFMKPDLVARNAAWEGCCSDLESVSDADRVVETMSVLGVRPNELSFVFLAYSYALKGLEERIDVLGRLMDDFGFFSKGVFYSNLISGYAKSGSITSISNIILRCLREENQSFNFCEETYTEVVKGFLQHGRHQELVKVDN